MTTCVMATGDLDGVDDSGGVLLANGVPVTVGDAQATTRSVSSPIVSARMGR